MSGIFLRWGFPALLTVIGGTGIALATSGAAIEPDLAARAEAALAAPQFAWASVDFDSRDAIVSGVATDQRMIDTLFAQLSTVHGVRSVTSNVVLAEFVSPFPFAATLTDQGLTLSGGLPDEAARGQIRALAGAGAIDETRLMSGAPDRARWSAAIALGLRHMALFDGGAFELADLTLSIAGRARDAAAYEALLALGAASPPKGVTLARRDVEPPLASPYEFRAEFDGKRLSIEGFTPNAEFANELGFAAVGNAEVETDLALASGAPEGFETQARLLIENLLQLEAGKATISGAASTLEGAPADAETVDRVQQALGPTGATVTLAPPRVTEYWLSAGKSAAGIVLEGYVPDATMRDRLQGLRGVTAEGLELARGAPVRFEAAVDLVLGALGRMSEGNATVQGTVISLEGRAQTVADFDGLAGDLEGSDPPGLTFAATTLLPPLADPFTWTAKKGPDGAISLAGNVPSRALQQSLRDMVPQPAADTMVLADGAPKDFPSLASKALQVLPLLDRGSIAFDGEAWTLEGAVDTAVKAFAAESRFTEIGLNELGWSYEVALPKATPKPVLPIIDPYVWRAQKVADGTVTFTGFLPTEQLRRFLSARAGDKLVDSAVVGAGAPADFIPAALAGIDALMAMPQGTLAHDAGNWTLTGEVAVTAERLALQQALEEATDMENWEVAIQARDAAPVASPFTWAAVKNEEGLVTLTGHVPTDEMRSLLAARAGPSAEDTMLAGSGEPAGFADAAAAGLEALARLDHGEVRFDGRTWSLTGQPDTAGTADAVRTALTANPAVEWTASLATPTAAPPQAVAELPPATEPAVAEADADTAAAEAAEVQPSAPPVIEPQPQVAGLPEPVAEPLPAAKSEALTEPEATAVAALPEAVAAPDAVATPAAAPAVVIDPKLRFTASKPIGGEIAFSGVVPAEAMRRHLAVVSGTEPSPELAVAIGLPPNFVINADAGTRALRDLLDGEFGLENGSWMLRGRAESEAQKAAVLAELGGIEGFGGWRTEVGLMPSVDLCRHQLTAFSSRNSILFQSGSARITEDSAPALDELTLYLKACPEAVVHVEGHTDSDGEDAANLALSVSRAEAVVSALILRGVPVGKLYAVGYGESLPIASNDTGTGKQANRRIAFSIVDDPR